MALQANDSLCGNQPSEGWGSRNLGRQKSFSLYLPKQPINILPTNVREMVISRPSVIKRQNPHTAGSSIIKQSLFQKRSVVSDNVQSDEKRVRFDENLTSQSETQVFTKPTSDTKSSQLDLTYLALAKLYQQDGITIKFPSVPDILAKLVKSLPSSTHCRKAKYF